jgi:hypothetical protein
MMDASWSILLSHAETSATTTTNDAVRPDGGGEEERVRRSWAAGQLPRVLRCIGDLRSHRMEHGVAVDAYVRSMRYREESWDRWKEEEKEEEEEEEERRRRGVRRQRSRGDGGKEDDGDSSDAAASSLEGLRRRRHLVEAYALVAEELLACPDGEDVVARRPDNDDGDGDGDGDGDDIDGGGEGGGLDSAAAAAAAAEGARMPREVVLAKAEDRLDYARGHYDMAREGLEDVLCRYAGLAAAGVDLGSEKEDIGYLVMTVVGVGNTIGGIDR